MLVGAKTAIHAKMIQEKLKMSFASAGHASTMLHLIILDFWSILVKSFGPWVVWEIKTVNKERSFIAFVNMYMYHNYFCGFRNYLNKKVNRKVQDVPKSQTAANYQEAEKKDKH